jgi:Cellulose binding domain/Glycosyl hydrolases family 18
VKRFRARLIIVAALLITAAATGYGIAPAQAAGGLSATFSKDSDWGSGYQGKYTVKNASASTITSWKVEFDLPSGTMGTFWDSLITSSGSHQTAVNREYNGTVAPGASVSFGFIVNGGGGTSPVNCKLNGASCDAGGGGGGDTTPPSTPANLRVTGTTSTSVSLAWNASTDNVGVTGYDVFRGTTMIATAAGTTATVSQACATTATYRVRAHDAAGNNSGLSNQVSATTGSCGTTPPVALPVAPYVDMGAFPTPDMPSMATSGNLKGFTMAFIIAVGCRASWFNAFDPRTRWSGEQVDAIRARGGDVKISFGGANGIELAQACTTVSALAAEYQAVVNAYQLKYIDLDIEGAAVADPTSVNRRSQALAQVQRATPGLKVSLTLPVLPEGLTADGVNVVRSAISAGVNIDLVNVMAMDYQRPSGDYGEFAKQAAQSTFNQIKPLFPGLSDAQVWRKIGVTPMLGKNDDGGTFFQSDARDLVTDAKAKHYGFLSFWEETRDRNACTGALFQCTNIPQTPFEFSKIFAGFTG